VLRDDAFVLYDILFAMRNVLRLLCGIAVVVHYVCCGLCVMECVLCVVLYMKRCVRGMYTMCDVLYAQFVVLFLYYALCCAICLMCALYAVCCYRWCGV